MSRPSFNLREYLDQVGSPAFLETIKAEIEEQSLRLPLGMWQGGQIDSDSVTVGTLFYEHINAREVEMIIPLYFDKLVSLGCPDQPSREPGCWDLRAVINRITGDVTFLPDNFK